MQGSTRTKKVTSSVTAKVTPDEEAQITEAATRRGLSKSQWLRQTVLRGLRGSPDTRLILAKVIGARTIVVALLASLSKGNQITDEVIKAVIDQVNLVKSEAADKRMHSADGAGQ